MSNNPNCKGCFFSDAVRVAANDIETTLVCKFNPPQIFTTMQQMPNGQAVMSVVNGFPNVPDDLWCHQYKPKLPEPDPLA